MIVLLELSKYCGLSIKQLLCETSWELLIRYMQALGDVQVRDKYYAAILPRLTDESIEALRMQCLDTFEGNEKMEPKKQTLKDLERSVMAFGGRVINKGKK